MRRKIKCGDEVLCLITGFKGTVTAITEHINGCVQCLVIPKVKEEDKYPDGVELDIQQLEKIKKKVTLKKSDKGGAIRKISANRKSFTK